MISKAGRDASTSIEYGFLADHPQLAETLAMWAHAEWGHLAPEDTLADSVERFRLRAVRGRIPLCLVALEQHEAVGCVVLKTAEEITRGGLTPWLGALYVRPDRRGYGIASHLIQFALGVAKELGLSRLYLSTVDSEALYRRHGWQPVERFVSGGESVVLMCRELSQ